MKHRISRRRIVGVFGASLVAGLAGCIGDGPGEPGTIDDADHGDHDHDAVPDGGAHDHGDENDESDEDTPGSEGLVYAFAPDTIGLLDPTAGEVITEFDVSPGNRNWGDVRLAHDAGTLFAVDSALDQVAVIDTEARDLLGFVDVGSDPVHAFVPVEGELWVHADGEGRFYVVDTETHDVIETVESGLEGDGHGKIVHHERLYPYAYATNVNDPAALVIDLENYERVTDIEVGPVGGTHYVSYAPGANLVYYEWFGGETVVIDPETNEIVDRLDFTGGMARSPDDEVLGIWTDEKVYFLDANSPDSDVLETVELEGAGPDDVEFVAADGVLYAYVPTVEDVAVIDVAEATVVEHVSVGEMDAEAAFASRDVEAGDGFVLATADADGTVSVIDTTTQEVAHTIEVVTGVDTLRYIPE